eukprot:TRINITY_DN862_c0_g1_i2.p1 TRINITY_DN862_c0_g1~~TRINITY_DN862_c0_g1_i2.p1  ORF type:complete len:241 (-),score=17.27 TRINITY_DN862_c0_g1_i2:218-868(-)
MASCWSMATLHSALPCYPRPSYASADGTCNARPFPANSSSATSITNRSIKLQCSLATAKSPPLRLSIRPKAALQMSSFLSFSPLISGGMPSFFRGCQWYMMRHGRKVPKLGRPADQRKALLRGLTTQLLRHGRIQTTRARAKAMRKWVDKMITLAKKGTLHHRRQALAFIYDKQLVHALFAEVNERYGERNGGYTRIIRGWYRRGDCAPMVFIELV